jgi:hypothetical protein
MNGKAAATLKKSLVAVGGAGAALALLASLYTTPLCACASVAESVLRVDAPTLDAEHLQRIAERDFPLGTPQAGLIARLGTATYAKYCLQGRGGAALVCMFPHDANFWRDRHVQLAFGFDGAGRLSALRASPIVRYAWF